MFICGVLLPDFPVEFEGELSEARALAVAAGGEIVGEGIVQRRVKVHPATLMGRGKVEEIGQQVAALSPDVVLVDNGKRFGCLRMQQVDPLSAGTARGCTGGIFDCGEA